MDKTPAEQLLHVIKNGDDKDIAFSLGDLLFQFETYALNGSTNTLGLMTKHPDMARDLFAHKAMLDEIVSWLRSLYGPLYLHSGMALPTHDPLKRVDKEKSSTVLH